MHLIRLVYASKVAKDFDVAEIASIVDASKRNNRERNITGVLSYSNRYFLQCIEGSRLDVNALYHYILADSRHRHSAILQYSEIDQRDFDDWSMGYIPAAAFSGQLVSTFSATADFEPFSMSGESCHLLLKALAELGITQ